MINPKVYRWIRNIALLLVLPLGVAIAAVIGHMIGYEEGHKAGRAEAEQISRLYKSWDSTPIDLALATTSPANPQITALPTSQSTIMATCEKLTIIANEVLVRDKPDLQGTVITALAHDTNVGVVCSSEQVIKGVSWVNITIERPNEPVLSGWIPGQDIGYPPVCLQGRTKKAIDLYHVAGEQADILRHIPQDTAVGVICNSAQIPYRSDRYWVRVKLIIDGDIVLGWTLAADVL